MKKVIIFGAIGGILVVMIAGGILIYLRNRNSTSNLVDTTINEISKDDNLKPSEDFQDFANEDLQYDSQSSSSSTASKEVDGSISKINVSTSNLNSTKDFDDIGDLGY